MCTKLELYIYFLTMFFFFLYTVSFCRRLSPHQFTGVDLATARNSYSLDKSFRVDQVSFACGTNASCTFTDVCVRAHKVITDDRLCTYTRTGSVYEEQPWFFCDTCDAYNERGGKGCCEPCARLCHAGHKLRAGTLQRQIVSVQSRRVRVLTMHRARFFLLWRFFFCFFFPCHAGNKNAFYCDCGSVDAGKCLKLTKATAEAAAAAVNSRAVKSSSSASSLAVPLGAYKYLVLRVARARGGTRVSLRRPRFLCAVSLLPLRGWWLCNLPYVRLVFSFCVSIHASIFSHLPAFMYTRCPQLARACSAPR